jgi:ribosomal protein L5
MNFIHNNNIIDLEFLNKFYINKSINNPCIEKIIIRTSIMDSDQEQFASFSQIMSLCEVLSFQKSFIKNFKISLKGKGQKQYSFNCITTLRKENMYNFLYFLIHNVLINLKENFLNINRYIYTSSYSFTIKDVNIFPSISEYFIKWRYPLFFIIALNHKNKFYLNFILRNFSIPTDIKNEVFK